MERVVIVSLPSGRSFLGEIRKSSFQGNVAPQGFTLVHEDGDESETVWEVPNDCIVG